MRSKSQTMTSLEKEIGIGMCEARLKLQTLTFKQPTRRIKKKMTG